ncbi:centromere protein O isoform X2 [Brachionichthys hirsutus]|uniref:centromere protein O isoform X2 n=1 Tax=Brachionichthys hirsutus TaxID=412623 RepID=UPI003604D095
MEAASAKGVIGHLTLLEAKARSREVQPEQRSSVSGLRAKVKALTAQRDRLKAEIETYKKLQKIRSVMDEEEEDMDEDSENSELLRLMARHEQLKDLLPVRPRDDSSRPRAVRFSADLLPGRFVGDLQPGDRPEAHAEDRSSQRPPVHSPEEPGGTERPSDGPEGLSGPPRATSERLRRTQATAEELHPSVEVAESNMLCSKLVMIFAAPAGKKAVLCSLDYTDHARCLPTGVRVESEDESLLDSSSWKKVHGLLMETPVHQVLITMKKMKIIV